MLKVGQEIWVKGVVEDIDKSDIPYRIAFKDASLPDLCYWFKRNFDYCLEPPKAVDKTLCDSCIYRIREVNTTRNKLNELISEKIKPPNQLEPKPLSKPEPKEVCKCEDKNTDYHLLHCGKPIKPQRLEIKPLDLSTDDALETNLFAIEEKVNELISEHNKRKI